MKRASFKWVRAALLVTLTCASLGIGQSLGQTTATTPANGEPMLQAAAKPSQTIEISVGESRTLDAAWPVKRVSVADPEVADIDASSPRTIQLRGKSIGITEITLENEKGDRWRARLEVNADTSRLQG